MNSLGRRTLVALGFGLATTALRAEVVLYANDFETAIGTQWSTSSTYG